MTTVGAQDADVVSADIAGWATGRLLSTAARLVEHAYARRLDDAGLTHAGLVVLHHLDDGTRSQAELARTARVEPQTMSRTIDRLVREGLVVRRPDAEDRRRHVIERTATGDAAWLAAHEIERQTFPPLEDEGALRTTLLALIHSLEADATPARTARDTVLHEEPHP